MFAKKEKLIVFLYLINKNFIILQTIMRQQTIENIVEIEGCGLHTGKKSKVRLLPEESNKGIYFVRTDIDTKPTIRAIAENVSDTSRGTTITENSYSVSTIEHLMATLMANEIDNLRIEVNCEELPILDGSGKYWLELLKKGKIKQLEAEKQYFVIKRPFHYVSEDKKVEFWALPSENFTVTCTIDFDSDLIGTQMAKLQNKEEFNTDFVNCRTFVFLSEVSALMDRNLIKGGDLDNAIVFADKVLDENTTKKLADFYGRDIFNIKVERGIINTIKLQYNNECARHKLLDFMGDIALAGVNIKGEFVIIRPGHKSNTEFAKKLKYMNVENNIPIYDPNKEPIFDTMAIKKRLPHRFPMLLIDKIIEVGEDYIVGLKNVTINEDFFNGHFPEEPVMPGVLIVEALGQTGGMLVLKDVKEGEQYNTYFMKFGEVKFRHKVVPGDTLLLKLQQEGAIKKGIIQMKGTAYVGNKVCVEAKLMAMVTKK